jgi:hypothetical protein
MLSEDAIDNLVQPIVTRQESINTYVLSKIAENVKTIGKLSSEDIKRMQILVRYGADVREMNKELARLSNLQVRDIKSLIKTVAIETHLDAKPLYDYRHRAFIPYVRNKKLQSIVTAIGDVTAKTYENLSNSKATGFLIRDLRNPSKLRFQSIDDTYKSVIDEAIQASQARVVDYRTAMRRTLKQLSDSGIRRLSWDSGYTQRLDTAVRRNLLDGIRAIDQAIEDQIGEEIGADGKELSAHINCALDHEPFQGHIFTNAEYEKLQSSEDFVDIDGRYFTGVRRIIGIWNCHHIARSIIIGVTEPRYTKEQLEKFIEDNHRGYTLPNGKHITMYECTQMQRQMETRIRYAKDEQMILQKSGDIEGAKLARQKVVAYTKQYEQFSKSCGLKVHKDRAQVLGYRAIKY